jgi:lysozyme
VAPGQPFTKTWRVKNTGNTRWGAGYSFAFFGDKQVGAPDTVPLPQADPGQTVDVSVTMIAPVTPMYYRSTWRAKNANCDWIGPQTYLKFRVSNHPNEGTINRAIDLSHWNKNKDWKKVRDDGIWGIIHKATQGWPRDDKDAVDEKYAIHKAGAEAVGLAWGAYHFGIGSEPIKQAEHYLKTVKPTESTLLVLDFENWKLGPNMNLHEAEQFATHIHQQAGRWPVLYTGYPFLSAQLKGVETTILSNCPLWIAAYNNAPEISDHWPTWTFWQYTDGKSGSEPRKVDGIGSCDRDKFNGTMDNLLELWGF